jgi:hypothetical protein
MAVGPCSDRIVVDPLTWNKRRGGRVASQMRSRISVGKLLNLTNLASDGGVDAILEFIAASAIAIMVTRLTGRLKLLFSLSATLSQPLMLKLERILPRLSIGAIA